MNRIFYTQINTQSVRRPTTKASGFSGRPDRGRMENEALTNRRVCFYSVVFDASQTISPDARFGKMDLNSGAAQGSWVPGTIFKNVRTGELWYFDGNQRKIRKVKSKGSEVQKFKGANAV